MLKIHQLSAGGGPPDRSGIQGKNYFPPAGTPYVYIPPDSTDLVKKPAKPSRSWK